MNSASTLKRGFFYETWQSPGSGCPRISVPATQYPNFPKTFLDEELKATGSTAFRQEYLGEFDDDRHRGFTRPVTAVLSDIEPLRL
jgi:hypothetical protein